MATKKATQSIARRASGALTKAKESAAKAKSRASAAVARAKESVFITTAAGAAGAAGGGYAGGRMARRWTIGDTKTKKGMDGIPLVGAVLVGAGMMVKGPVGAAVASAGAAAAGASLGVSAALDALELTETFDAAVEKAKKDKE